MERFSNLRSNLVYDNSESEPELRSQNFSGPYNHLPNTGYFTNISSASSFGSGLSDVTSGTHEPTAAAGLLSSRFCATESFDNQEYANPAIQSRNSDFFMESSDDTLTNIHSGYRNRFNNCGLGCVRESSNSSQGSTRSRSTLGINIGSPISATDLCLAASNAGSQSEDESPVFHSITTINSSEPSNYCTDCRYNHMNLSIRSCSCSCHTNDSEFRTASAHTRSGFADHLVGNSLLTKSNKYDSPAKRSWTGIIDTAANTHPSFPPLTTPVTENCWMACANSSMNYFNLSNYDPPNTVSSNNHLLRPSSRNPNLTPSPSSVGTTTTTTTLELTGDVRTIDFNSYDQSPLRI